ncbi:LA_2272 family surface repeat-containing protein [Tenacibaculum jejuense]|uniref:Uncharacterized protein n=1 Tax=Tenacibaculum jejuense TaxID=584609 RepID=A0A238UD57_9FLAO|nr:hypothetical protein [Tenacibaculum jejuense]SNR17101.1 conserved protein of unknown function [Tenacibaculum jejuense]
MKKKSKFFIHSLPIVILLHVLLFLKSNAQVTDNTYFIGLTPSSSYETINGLGISYSFLAFEKQHTNVNGIRLSVEPFSMFMPFLTIIHAPFMEATGDDLTYDFKYDNIINGINLTLFDPNISKINGLEINVSGSRGTVTNGMSVGLVNMHYKISGISLGILRNRSKKCRGIQIGLVNECENLKGLQIGLWNKNSKRNMPFINWNF